MCVCRPENCSGKADENPPFEDSVASNSSQRPDATQKAAWKVLPDLPAPAKKGKLHALL